MTNEDLRREIKVYEEAVLSRMEEEKKIPGLVDRWMETSTEDVKTKLQGTIDTMCLTFRESARKAQEATAKGKMLRIMLAMIAGDKDAIKELGEMP